MDDAELLNRIQALVDEEHRLEREHVGEGADDTTKARLAELEVGLDQHRSRPHAGEPRPISTLEGCKQ